MNLIDKQAIEVSAEIQAVRATALHAWASSPEVRATFGGNFEAFLVHRVAAAQSVEGPFVRGSMPVVPPPRLGAAGTSTVGASQIRGAAVGTPAAWLELDRRAAAKWAGDGALRRAWRFHSLADFQRYTRFTGGKFL